MSPTPAIPASYDLVLVIFSVAIAILASYTALVVAGRIQMTAGISRYLWLLGAALLMGGGIWSMHFVGMLAFRMPLPVTYDPQLTFLSLLVPVFFTAVGFYILAARGSAPLTLVGAGLLMGLGMVAMHYTGMAALQAPVRIEHRPLLVSASALIAFVASVMALGLAFRSKAAAWHNAAGAATMGAAITGMHYTAMAAAEFTRDLSAPVPASATMLNPALLGIVITAAAFVLLFLGLLAALFDRRYMALAPSQTAVRGATESPNLGHRFDGYSPKFALLVIILFFVVVVGVAWGLTAWRDYKQAIEDVQIVAQSTVRLVEEHVDRAMGAGDLVMQHVIGLIDQLGLEAVVSSPAVWESVRRMEASLPHLGNVSILDAQGNLVFTTRQFPAPDGRNFAAESYFRALRVDGSAEPLVSRVVKGDSTNGDFFNVARRLKGEDGAFAGVVLMAIQTDYLLDFYADLNLGPTSAVAVFREDGSLVTRQPPPDSDADPSPGQLVRMHLQRSPWGTFESHSALDGVERVVSYRHAASVPLVVTASIAKDSALAEWRARLHRNAALGLVIVAALGALSWLAVRSLRREELAANALRLARDDLDRRVRERTAELEAALADKEILFKEVHHRVKNNLQVICSLLNLQSNRFDEPAVRRAFEEAYNRVYSISLVHKALYDQNAAAQIDFASYLRDLCDNLSRLYGASARNIQIEVSAAESTLDLNRAVPLALIVNEVISNALKHAFPNGRAGRIEIGFAARGSKFHLTIRDDGIGIGEDAARNPAKSLGLVIVNALAHQVDATVTYRNDGGTWFELLSDSGQADACVAGESGTDGGARGQESAAAQ